MNKLYAFLSPLLVSLFGFGLSGVVYADCTSPAGKAGQIAWASNLSVPVFCDGTTWQSMAGSLATPATDTRIGTITANKWCVANAGGTGFDCTADEPTSGTTVTPGGVSGSIQLNDGGGGFAGRSDLVADASGNVAIGGSSANAKLDVNGAIKVGGSGSETCDSSHYGVFRRNPTTGAIQTCALR